MTYCILRLGLCVWFFACGVILTCVARPLNGVISNPAELKDSAPPVCAPSAPPFQTSVPPVWYCHYFYLKAARAHICLHVGCVLHGHSARRVVKIFTAHAGLPPEAESSTQMRRNSCILMNSMTSLSGGEILVNGEAHTSQQHPRDFVSLRIRVLGIAVAQRGAEEKMRHEEMD